MKTVRRAFLGFCLLVMGATASEAADTTPLGNASFAVKIGSLNFTAGDIKDSGAETATYVGLEGYVSVAPNLYLGGEIGHARSTGSFINIDIGRIDTEVTFVPVEVNLKYAVEAARRLSVDFGGGLSGNYARYQAKTSVPLIGFFPPGVVVQDVPDWLFGAQFFTDVNFIFDHVFIGLFGKVQLVVPGASNNFNGSSSYTGYNNWRVGGQIGVRF